jgi:hypothetical protein
MQLDPTLRISGIKDLAPCRRPEDTEKLTQASRAISKIGGNQIIGPPASANVHLGSRGTYQNTVGIERVQKTRLIRASIWLNSPQCVFVYEK